MKHIWKDTLTWGLIAAGAVALALVAPKGVSVLGQMPSVSATDLNKKPLEIPEGLRAERTLVLLSFQRGQSQDVDSWIKGLGLHGDSSISWVRMAIINDPGDQGRSVAESRLLARYTAAQDRARLVPVFTNRDAFIKSTGLDGIEQMAAVVVNRQGEVLARAQGPLDADKKALILDTLHGQAF